LGRTSIEVVFEDGVKDQRVAEELMALELRQWLVVFEDVGGEEGLVCGSGLRVRLRAFGVVLERRLVELESFFDLDLLGVVNLLLGLLLELDVEGAPYRCLGLCDVRYPSEWGWDAQRMNLP
jgi:hypothetical protein